MKSYKGNAARSLLISLFTLSALVFITLKILQNQINKSPSLENINTTSTAEDITWKILISKKYHYQISYPSTFTIQGLDKNPNEINPAEYPKLLFANYEDAANGLKLEVWANSNKLSPQTWVTNEIARVEKEKTECTKSKPEEPCSNLTLKDVTLSQEHSAFKDLSAYKTSVFKFDHTDACLLFTKYDNFYQICYDSSDPNDPNLETHLVIYKKMLDSFEFLP